ncbi:ATP synthase subunit alpha, partial [Striga asiatica]
CKKWNFNPLLENNVRLACVKHIASVPSEPGSNSSFDYDWALQWYCVSEEGQCGGWYSYSLTAFAASVLASNLPILMVSCLPSSVPTFSSRGEFECTGLLEAKEKRDYHESDTI